MCFTALLALVAAPACADEAPAPPTPEHPIAFVAGPIINGFAPDAPRHEATVALLQRSGSSIYPDIFCSGTLISPDVVVTAAHCLEVRKGKRVSAAPPSSVAVYVGDATYSDPDGLAYAAVETVLHPSYNPSSLANDIALIRISPPVAHVAPVPALPASLGFSSATLGETLNFAGFGDDEWGQSNVKLQANGSLGGLGCAVAGCYGQSDAATQLSYTQYESGPCFGDSGGPAFVQRGGTWYLGGVTSWGDSYCAQFGVSTRVDAYEGWIAAFAAPTPEPVCVADGVCVAECATGADPDCDDGGGDDGACGDGVCGAGESCDGRSGTAACPADCAGKTNGKPSGRFCYVEGACDGPGC